MPWSRVVMLALLSLTVPPTVRAPHEEALPRGPTSSTESSAETWTRRHARVHASRVRLHALGARTHANWVLFRLPFDSTDWKHIRSVRFEPSARSRTDVGTLRVGSVCLEVTSSGAIEWWARYTVSGIGQTIPFERHPAPPTDDPTILGINVPTRVANHVACGRDEGHLLDPEDWSLDIAWEER